MPFSRYHGIFNPAELDILNHVFLRVCIDRGYIANDPAAEKLALQIVSFRNNGIADEVGLLAALAKREADSER